MDNQFLRALSEAIREGITQHNEIQVEGIGSFRYKHQKQFQKQYDNGRVVMMPPKDTIAFIPE